jgi:hypothetical protein
VATKNPQRVDFGKALRTYRIRAGLETKDLDQDPELDWHAGKASRIESGGRTVVAAEAARLAVLLKLSADERARFVQLAAAAKEKTAPARVADFAASYVTFERAARAIDYYGDLLIYGPAQSPKYARELLLCSGVQDIESRLANRLDRQKVLVRESAPAVRIVLGEAALYQQVGGKEGLREALEHLLSLQQMPNVSIRIVPFTAGGHRLIGTSYHRVEIDGTKRVYVEGLTKATYIHEEDEVALYETEFERLLKGAAVDEGASATMLTKRIQQL